MDIKQHETDLATATKDLETATNVRNKEKETFDETIGTKSASEAALGKAIPAIEKGMGGAFLQTEGLMKKIKRAIHGSQQITDGNRKDILAFLSGETPGSGEILGMLKAMKDELTRDIASLKKTEAAAVAGFEDMKASKEKEIEFADESIESKKERVGVLAVEIVQTKDVVEDSMKEAEEAEKFAATLDAQCAAKKKEWAALCKARADELAAIGEAIAILTDDDALDVFKKTALVQQGFQSTFQVEGQHKNRFTGELTFLQSKVKPAAQLQKAQAILSAMAAKKVSQPINVLLFTLRTRMRSVERAQGAVDFSEIMKMIDEMVAILLKENKDDASQKDFCIAELEKTEREKTSADDKMASLTSQIEEISDNVAEAAEKIKELQEGVASLDKDVHEATEQRKKEHEDYVVNLQLNEAAVGLLGKAKNRMMKFYNPTLYKAPPKKEMTMEEKIIASGSSALVQQEQAFDGPESSFDATFVQIRRVSLLRGKVAPPEAPETFGAYEKKSEKSGGIMALMDMMINEMKASLQEAKFAEKQAQKDYVELMSDSQATREQDGKSIVNEQASKADLEASLNEAKESQALTLEQLANIHETLAKLHGSCDFIVKNFEIRLNARTAEIEGLKTAKAVLAGANFS